VHSPLRERKAFTRPPFYAAFLWPLGRLPYPAAHAVWQLLNLAALAGFVVLWAPGTYPVTLCCWFFPTWISFACGQDTPFVLLAVASAVLLLRKNRPFLAGVVFALCAIKFHLFLLLPLLILAKRLWRFSGGLLAGGTVLAGISVAVAGWDWPARQFELLKLNEAGESSQAFMPNLNGLFHSFPAGHAFLAVTTLAVVCGAWYVVRRSSIEHAISAMLIAGLLIGMHAFLYDCTLLLPYFLLLSVRDGFGRAFPLWAAISFSTIALTNPSISWIGQLALLLLFGLIVYQTYRRGQLRESQA